MVGDIGGYVEDDAIGEAISFTVGPGKDGADWGHQVVEARDGGFVGDSRGWLPADMSSVDL